MDPLNKLGADLFPHLADGDEWALRELFRIRTQAWSHHMMHGEGSKIGLFSDLAYTEVTSWDDCIDSGPAFQLIPTAVNLVLEQSEMFLSECAFELLAQLIRCAGTTEMPGPLRVRWHDLGTLARDRSSRTLACWQDIERWYPLRDVTS